MTDHEGKMLTDLCSIVVPTRNEEDNIGRCLESLLLQDYSPIEIIVVDNWSSDATFEIATKYTSKVYQHGPERSAQRNYGLLDKAVGAYAFYVDADMILGPRVVSGAVKLLKAGFVGVCVPEVVLGNSWLSRLRRFERPFYDGTPIDAVRAFPLALFKKVGGFDEELFARGSGEDWDLDQKLIEHGQFAQLPSEKLSPSEWELSNFCLSKGAPVITASGIYHNESQMSVARLLRKKVYYAEGFSGYVNKWGKGNPRVAAQLGIYSRLVKVFLEDGKWKRSLSHPLLVAQVISLKVVMGVSVLGSKWRSKCC